MMLGLDLVRAWHRSFEEIAQRGRDSCEEQVLSVSDCSCTEYDGQLLELAAQLAKAMLSISQ